MEQTNMEQTNMEQAGTDRAAARTPRVAVLGAGGRAGRAVSAEFVRRGHRVLGVVRDPDRHAGLRAEGIDLVRADATGGPALVDALAGADVIVVAVTPFTAPPPTFDGFDETYYEQVVRAVAAAARTSPPARLLTIGLFATLTLADGGLVLDDAELFPPALLPFARAHARVLPALRQHADTLDWLVLTPPAGLHLGDGAATARPELVAGPVERARATGALSYAELARAVVDQALTPDLHRTQVTVLTGQPR
ncbi:NAD(P)H-binding protein [Frankia sp. Ag45/Mut15]|uniref:NAD(P)H-binding protein n=1 Tax=Frankia umida TaxID=573489 RepID=A0ABT0K0U1_9ACTN|nr:NAD(P)H-binding protein [Frankia umida]MCK9877403.1 NAD(P)H-binding protein [Frankia umida]